MKELHLRRKRIPHGRADIRANMNPMHTYIRTTHVHAETRCGSTVPVADARKRQETDTDREGLTSGDVTLSFQSTANPKPKQRTA